MKYSWEVYENCHALTIEYYESNTERRGDLMLSVRQYLQLTGTVFSIIGLLHFIRLFAGWTIVLAGYTVPVWVSLLGVIIAWVLAYNAFKLAGKAKKR